MCFFFNESKVKFKDLTKEQRYIIIDAKIKGKAEMFSGGMWATADKESIIFEGIYRTKEVTLEIPWHRIDKKWNWVAMDDNGIIYFYEEEPILESSFWVPGKGYHCMNALAIQTEGVNWKTSKQKRT